MFIYPKYQQYPGSSPVDLWTLLNKTQSFIAYLEKKIRATKPLRVEELPDTTNLSENLPPLIDLSSYEISITRSGILNNPDNMETIADTFLVGVKWNTPHTVNDVHV